MCRSRPEVYRRASSCLRDCRPLLEDGAPPKRRRAEKSYLEAIAIIFDKAGTPNHDERVRNYSAAMGKIFSAYPQDTQAAIIYAMSLLKDGMPNDPNPGSGAKIIVNSQPSSRN